MSSHAVRIWILTSPIVSYAEAMGIVGVLRTKQVSAYIGGIVSNYSSIPYHQDLRIKVYTFTSLSPSIKFIPCSHIHLHPTHRREKGHLFVELGYTLQDNVNSFFKIRGLNYQDELAWAWERCNHELRKSDRYGKIGVRWIKNLENNLLNFNHVIALKELMNEANSGTNKRST